MSAHGPDFSLAFSRALGNVIAHIHGPLDAATSPELKARLIDIIEGQGNRQVVIDLRTTTTIDAAGLSVLVDALKRMKRNGGELILSGPSDDVEGALAAAGLDKVFVVTPAWAHPAGADGGNRFNHTGRHTGWGNGR